MKTHRTPLIHRIAVTDSGPAKLARKAIPLKYDVAETWRDVLSRDRKSLQCLETVLPRLQVVSVVVGTDLHPFVVPQLANTSRVLTDAGDLCDIVCVDHLTDVFLEVGSNSVSCSQLRGSD